MPNVPEVKTYSQFVPVKGLGPYPGRFAAIYASLILVAIVALAGRGRRSSTSSSSSAQRI